MNNQKSLIQVRNKLIVQMYNDLRKIGFSHEELVDDIFPHTFWIKPRTIKGVLSGEFDNNNKTEES